MGLVYNVSFYWAPINLRIVIINVVLQCLQVLVRLILEIIISEHIADFFEMIWTFETHEIALSSLASHLHIRILVKVIIVSISIESLVSSTCFLLETWEIFRYDKGKIFDSCPHFKFSFVLLASFQTFHFTELGAQYLNEDFVFLEERGLKTEHWWYTLWDWVYSSKLIS